jgi:LuxR family maltose regulon positive regulatory protein
MAGTDTIAQIAYALGVTQNTIKSQLRGLYRKLGAVSRDEAVLAARTAGLLS